MQVVINEEKEKGLKVSI